MKPDGDLAFGAAAVYLRRLSPDQWAAVLDAWADDPSRGLRERIQQVGRLSAEDVRLIEAKARGLVSAPLPPDEARLDMPTALAERNREGVDSDQAHLASTLPGLPPSHVAIHLEEEVTQLETPGRYTRISEHARGGMGRVLVVRDHDLGRDVALKELIAWDPDAGTVAEGSPQVQYQPSMARFVQEARVTGQLEHPSIVPVYELGRRSNGSIYYTMKLVRGHSFARGIHDAESLEKRLKLVPNFLSLCHALAYAHDKGVIHRDVKPQNVMIGRFGETVLIDWGLAKVQGQDDVRESEMQQTLARLRTAAAKGHETADGVALGTPHYMSPEQARGQLTEIGARSDVYALGAVLYEILTGRAPFDGQTYQEVLEKVVAEPPEPILTLEPEAPRELVAICERAMQRDPQRRYASAQELAEDIQRFLSGALVGAYRYGLFDYLRFYMRRHKPAFVTGILSALFLVALALYTHVRVSQERDQAVRAWHVERTQSYRTRMVEANSAIQQGRFGLAERALDAAPEKERNWEWGFYRRLCHRDLMTLAGHEGDVLSVAWAPDERTLLTRSSDGTARLWDSATGVCRATFTGAASRELRLADYAADGASVVLVASDGAIEVRNAATGRARAVLRLSEASGRPRVVLMAALSADRRVVAEVLDDGSACACDLATGRLLGRFAGSAAPLHRVALSSDGRLAAGWGASTEVQVWHTDTGKLLATLKGHRGYISSVAFSPDGRRILTGSDDRSACLWDTQTGERTARLRGHALEISAAGFSPDGLRVATASWDQTLRLWEASSGKELSTLAQPMPVTAIGFTPDGRRLVLSMKDNTVRVVESATGEIVAVHAGHSFAIHAIALSPRGGRLATASADETARIWPIEQPEGDSLARFAIHGGPVVNARLSDDGHWLATSSVDATARIIDLHSQSEKWVLGDHRGGVEDAVFTRDGEHVVTICDDGATRIWRLKDGTLEQTLHHHENIVACVALESGGRLAATGSHDGTAVVWELATGRVVRTFSGHSRGVTSIDFSKDGKRLVTGSTDCTARLWDIEKGTMIAELSDHTNVVEKAMFSPDGDRVATASRDATVRLWDGHTGAPQAVLKGQDAAVRWLAFSPDGQRLACGSDDFSARVWDVAQGNELCTLTGHRSFVWCANFNPAGDRIVTASSDGTARVWDLSGLLLAVLKGHTDGVTQAGFTRDGRFIYTASKDGTARLWGPQP